MTYILREKIKYLRILIRLGAFTMPYALAVENKLGVLSTIWQLMFLVG
jgi:hypothetical protein